MSEIVLTTEQQAVVDDRGGVLLVSAAAGSGKTKVLIDRVLKFVSEGHNIDEFLLITYTQAAAAELRGKMVAQLSKLLAQRPDNRHLQQQMNRVYLAQISTVHSFCGTILREFAHELELPSDFRTMDESEASLLREKAMQTTLDEVYAQRDDEQIMLTLDTMGAGRDDRNLPQLIYKVYNSVNCWKDPQARISELEKSVKVDACEDPIQTVWGKYHFDVMQEALQEYEQSVLRALKMIEADATLQPYALNFNDDLQMIRRLMQAKTWQELQATPHDFSKLKTVRNPADAELKDRVKKIREIVRTDLRGKMSLFSLSTEDVLNDIQITSEAICGLLKLVKKYDAYYKKEKRSHRTLDYQDLEHEALRLLTDKQGRPTGAAKQIAQRYVEVMVDEYQDTNAVQDAIFGTVAYRGNLFMVGDVKQSIYRFRLADPTCFLNRYESYPNYTEAQEGQPRKILLSDNFRSCPEVLSAANDLFRLLMSKRVGGLRYGDAEALRTSQKPHGRQPIELHCLDMDDVPSEQHLSNDELEAEFVAHRIADMLRQGQTITLDGQTRPIEADDIAILMRGVKRAAPIYISALKRYGIRCVCGNENIFESEAICTLIALLKVLDNPYQDIPLLTVAFSPLFRFTADELAAARAQRRSGFLFDALKCSEKGRAFAELISTLRDIAAQAELRTLLDEIDERIFLRTVYPYSEDEFDMMLSLVKSYESMDRYDLSGFLQYLQVQKEHGISTEITAEKGAVRIMTMHKSKGLEFPVVFLAGLNKKFNNQDLMADVLVDSELGIATRLYNPETAMVYSTVARDAISDRIRKENRSEEMRVLYVAMTRAKCRLVMTLCGKKMKSKLKGIAEKMTVPPLASFVGGAGSLGDWVLMCAMNRSEAGALFAVGGYPIERSVSEYPWVIAYHDAASYLPQEAQEESAQTAAQEVAYIPYSYAHERATALPSKLTATQLKGREMDEELAEFTIQTAQPRFDKPCFDKMRSLSAAQQGTAIHLAMEQLRFERCTSEQEIEQELSRMVFEGRMTQEQAKAVPAEKVLRFFLSETGRKVRNCKNIVREFKFTVLEDGKTYHAQLQDDEVMLQGVADCCLIEDDGLVLIDFKSDRIAQGEEAVRAERYRGQIDAYSRALARIFEMPVKQRLLYFFATDQAFEI